MQMLSEEQRLDTLCFFEEEKSTPERRCAVQLGRRVTMATEMKTNARLCFAPSS
jgi:hypothetical protein